MGFGIPVEDVARGPRPARPPAGTPRRPRAALAAPGPRRRFGMTTAGALYAAGLGPAPPSCRRPAAAIGPETGSCRRAAAEVDEVLIARLEQRQSRAAGRRVSPSDRRSLAESGRRAYDDLASNYKRDEGPVPPPDLAGRRVCRRAAQELRAKHLRIAAGTREPQSASPIPPKLPERPGVTPRASRPPIRLARPPRAAEVVHRPFPMPPPPPPFPGGPFDPAPSDPARDARAGSDPCMRGSRTCAGGWSQSGRGSGPDRRIAGRIPWLASPGPAGGAFGLWTDRRSGGVPSRVAPCRGRRLIAARPETDQVFVHTADCSDDGDPDPYADE